MLFLVFLSHERTMLSRSAFFSSRVPAERDGQRAAAASLPHGRVQDDSHRVAEGRGNGTA